jgi:RimJ/RimL family protein N-acetyltransferase
LAQAGNAASIRVLQKAGLRQTGRDRDGLTWEI